MKTKIVQVNPRDLKLLEINARYMRHEEFQRLVNNVKKDGALTSVPFCCPDDNGELEVLSGNHRVQAAIDAGLEEIDVMITNEKLSKSQKIAIQLSHNSIAGEDDIAVLKQLYEAIDDFDSKLYSGLDDKTLELIDKVSAESMSAFNLNFQVLNLVFLPDEMKKIKEVIKQVKEEVGKNKALVARMAEYDEYLERLDDISSAANIKNATTAFIAMLKIVENHMEEIKDMWIDDAPAKQWVPISSIVERGKIKADDARILEKAIERLLSDKKITKGSKEKGLSVLSQFYLDAISNKKSNDGGTKDGKTKR